MVPGRIPCNTCDENFGESGHGRDELLGDELSDDETDSVSGVRIGACFDSPVFGIL